MSQFITRLKFEAKFGITDPETGTHREWTAPAGTPVVARSGECVARPTIHGGGFEAGTVVDVETGARSVGQVITTTGEARTV